jgi:hypothetical protein
MMQNTIAHRRLIGQGIQFASIVVTASKKVQLETNPTWGF